ncbi:MAG: rhodanese-like domain-containing protein [Bacteroidetes bacterium]|nr:rhodanese-like domain-containing protein [Bacteroidota bacterium]MBV6462245.1 hypothetical protein [Flavobacteriales bacterium]WKZ74829.1 MAG: rhodanese-like domain-containing protein [Vicingaceae bacterium]MCL4816051.1 rhodanese-like domain-containing protein [Flavobacteriales bacterium]NOG95210.1 rhodanese-like domain-containing protein [Bacteroidota bacterium]
MNQDFKTILDVRTKEEFVSGNVSGSINIPLQDIPEQLEKIKKLAPPILLCCASGARSYQAEQFLKNNGIDCINAGSWLNIKC